MNIRQVLTALALAVAASSPAAARPNDIDADKSQRRAVTDPMDASDCPTIYRAARGQYFPRAKDHTLYKPEDCKTPLFWDGDLINANKSLPIFDKLPLCLGMRENINFYLQKYPNRCRRLTSSKWDQDLNQKLIWCAAKGYLKGGVIWLANNRMMSKGWAEAQLKKGAPSGFNTLFVTASEACFWHKVMGKPFPYSGKDKAAQAATKKAAAKGKPPAAPPKKTTTKAPPKSGGKAPSAPPPSH